MYGLLLASNALAWALAFYFFSAPHALLLGTAVLAFTFGLRHAVDADHISAIDNVTRKLMQEGKEPVAVGFFFSLGHSSVVFALTIAIVLGAGAVRAHLPHLQAIGGIAGTGISAIFLFLIAGINAFVLVDVVRAMHRMRRDGTYAEQSLNASLDRRGLLGRVFKPLLRLVTRSRDMFFIGTLFGLGFDTATEVGLLGIAAIEAGKGLPLWAILIFPALFAAGMSLIDATDGVLMLNAYGWALLDPARKLYYNVTVTAASVMVAVYVGTIELLSIAGRGSLTPAFGFAIVGFFAVAWIVSFAVHAVSKGSRPSATSHASRCFTYAIPNESDSARTYDS
jgi:nickel/cobalt transporter (NiCoT) family protein